MNDSFESRKYICTKCGSEIKLEIDSYTRERVLECPVCLKNKDIHTDEEDATEVYKYFLNVYFSQPIRVKEGHWPNFKTKAEVDRWAECLSIGAKTLNK